MENTEKTLSTERIYTGKILNLRRDIVQLPDGKEAVREIIEHDGAVAVLAVDGEDLLMVRQYRYPFAVQMLEIPAGKLEKGEECYPAALRELEEETGYTTDTLEDLGLIYPSVAYMEESIRLYLARNLRQTQQNLDEDEFLSVERMPFATVLEQVLCGEIKDAKTIIAVLRYQLILQGK